MLLEENMKRVKLLDILLVVFISMIVAGCSFGNTKKLVFSAGTPIRYQLEGPEHIVVQTALDLFANDLSTVLQAKLETNSQSPQIVICTLPPDSRDPLAGKSQGFRIEEKGGTLYVTGADAQGTAYGIMELSRMLGVSPWVWWADSTPLPWMNGLWQAVFIQSRVRRWNTGVFLSTMKTVDFVLGAGRRLTPLMSKAV